MHTTHGPYHCFVGIDIAAATFTAAWQQLDQPVQRPRTLPQTPEGLTALLAAIQTGTGAPHQTLIVMEATGSYWIRLATALYEAGYAVSVINALHAHHFAKSRGQRAKTDRIDAQMLVRFAIERQPTLWSPPPAVYHELRQRLAARDLLHRTRTQLRNHRHAVAQSPVVIAAVMAQLDSVIAMLEAQMVTLDEEIAHVLAQGAWAESAQLLQTIPGVGCITTAWLLVETKNFTISAHPKTLAAYAGLAPMPYESGTSVRGRPEIGHSGNRRLRVARCAAARKLLHLAWAIVTKQCAFDPAYGGRAAPA